MDPPDFTLTQLNNPRQMEFTDGQGWAATFTEDCRKVRLRGPTRTFTEQVQGAIDHYKRIKSSGFGTFPALGRYDWSGGLESDYSVGSDVGSINVTSSGVARRVIVNHDMLSNVDVKVSVTTDKAPAGADAIAGILMGYAGANKYYTGRISFKPDGSVQTSIQTRTAGADGSSTDDTTATVAVGAAGGYVVGQKWWIRSQMTSNGIVRCRIWKDGNTEPTVWHASISDSTYLSGRIGLRAIVNSGATNLPVKFSFDDFQLISAAWVERMIPGVRHNVYVHVLPLPYVMGQNVTDWLREKLLDPFRDILEKAFQYIGGAPAIYDPDSPSLQIAGNASYGPLYNTGRTWDISHASDGTREEGSDFSDYLGVTWTYDNGDVDRPESRQFRCLDCSGFVRMVYGYRSGLPMTTDHPLDGSAIPRRAVNIAASGPGVIVAQGAPPALGSLEIGDVVSFDADPLNPNENEGQVDHIGIYIGQDIDGNYRFMSSRKTINGPTIADVGGASTLNGTGLYATHLRFIRRF